MLRNMFAIVWRQHGLLQHLPPKHTPKHIAAEIQNPVSTKPLVEKPDTSSLMVQITKKGMP